jgi:hypothetical protein
MKHYKDLANKQYDKSEWTDREKATFVPWKDVQRMYCALRQKKDIHETLQSSMRFMLISTAIHIMCKRSDLGKVQLYGNDPKLDDRNYIAFKPEPVLVMNVFKTAKTEGKIREPLNRVYVEDLKASLIAHPRKYLFISSLTKTPYESNATYGRFFMRTFKHCFGVETGVTMWRHIQIIAEVDFNNTPWEKLKEQAHLRGHSVEMQLKVYRKVAGMDRKLMRIPKAERGKVVTCEVLQNGPQAPAATASPPPGARFA